MTEQSPQFVAAGVRRFLQSARHTALLQILREMVSAVREEDYHLADIFLALADYTAAESSFSSDTELTRVTVAALLREAAREAEQQDRELP